MSATPHSSTETTVQKERRLFRELFDHFINVLLNWLFDLRPERAQRRARYLLILLPIAVFLVTLIYYPLKLWGGYLQDIFLYLLNPGYAAIYVGNPFTNFINFIIQVIVDPRILQYVPIFIAPFFIAQQLAAFYLADIFELEDISVARRFVSEVALSGSDETIRITKGKVADQHLESPNYLIGGPGKVIVDLDTVALFEKADGTPHVIGPTGRDPGGKATIDGFERFRQAIDIRDHHVELRDQDKNSQSVKGRSRDGIPITATDVRLMFSIYRGENPQLSAEFPYPFSKDAIERIVYKSTSRVTPDQKDPSTYEFSWINNMIGLIRSQLGGFMSEHNLTEYMASIGTPELEKAKQREELIAEDVRRLAPLDERESESKAPKLPEFTPRHQITNLFSQFANEFTGSARNKGVELHWIGVGTWKTPPEIEVVSEKHLEAWKLSQENMRAGSPEAMSKAESGSTLEKMEGLIKHVPIEAYYDIIGSKKSFGKKSSRKQEIKFKDDFLLDDYYYDEDSISEEELIKMLSGSNLTIGEIAKRLNERVEAKAEKMSKGFGKESDRRAEMRSLLMEYRNQLLEAVQFMKAKGESVSPVIEEAIKHINNQMGFRHFVGRP